MVISILKRKREWIVKFDFIRKGLFFKRNFKKLDFLIYLIAKLINFLSND